ncbi:MAG: DUF1622 domain-containing protein [Eudoraea sp.]|uniref:DUF1622 domain-containing protein n=1 Tax=Eudoraea sp. TaxID=1979955 RepID=UPI003267CB0C
MSDQIIEILNYIIRGLEITGAGLLILGFIVATFRSIRQYIVNRTSFDIKNYRLALGRVVLIGLEVLVASVILKTIVVDETVQSLSFLVIMVAIRTILGWTMTLEMKGRWPWQ